MRTAAILAFLFAANCAAGQMRAWMPEMRLTFDPASSELSPNFARSIAADDAGGLHVVWMDARDGRPEVYYKRSVNGGRSWTADLRLSEEVSAKMHPAVAASGASVFVIWHDEREGAAQVFFKRSLDGGASWGPDVRISLGAGGANASIAASGDSVYVVWVDTRDTGEYGEVYFRASLAGGASWDAERRLSELPFDSYVATVAAEGTSVYAAWVDTADGNEEEYFRRSRDGGRTWDPAMRLTTDRASSWAPSLAVSRGVVHLLWFDQKDSPVQPLEAEEMLNRVMDLLGLRYAPAPAGVRVDHPEEAARNRAAGKMRQIESALAEWIAAGGSAEALGRLIAELQEMGRRGAGYLAKERKVDQIMMLMELTYVPGPPQKLSQILYLDALRIRVADKQMQIADAAPRWVAAGGDPQLLDSMLEEFGRAMQMATTEWEIYALRSLDGGSSWEPPRRLTRAPGMSARPSVVAEGSKVHAVWFDGRDGNAEVYYTQSKDYGATWQEEQRITFAEGGSVHPTIATSGGRLHVVWYDNRDGNNEIYTISSAVPRRRPLHLW